MYTLRKGRCTIHAVIMFKKPSDVKRLNQEPFYTADTINIDGKVDVYHTALIIGTKPYAVQFKVDIPLEDGTYNYAGHKIKDIKIASSSSADERFTSPMQKEDAISSVALAVLREKVNDIMYVILQKAG